MLHGRGPAKPSQGGQHTQWYRVVALSVGQAVLFFDHPLGSSEISIVSGLSSFKDENGEALPGFSTL